MPAKKLAKSLFDVVDDRLFYHSTDADFDFLRPNKAVTGSGIFGHESKEAAARYGKRSIPFKIRGKIADQSPDELLNKKIEEAGLVPLSDESSRDAYRRLIDQYPEQDLQSVFKSAGYGAFSRPTKKGDIVHAFDADSIIQMDESEAGFLGKGAKKIYHGTSEIFNDFDVSKSADGSIWFTDSKKSIEAGEVGASSKGRIVERLIDEDKLNLAGWDDIDKHSVDELINKGYDGVRMPDDGEVTYQIFYPSKLDKVVKSGFLPTTGSGLLAMYALSPDEARAAQIAATDTRDIGSIQAAKSDTASDLATLMRSYNRKVYNDPLLGMVSPKLPANLFDKMAYNEDIEASDILKGYAGLLGFDFD